MGLIRVGGFNGVGVVGDFGLSASDRDSKVSRVSRIGIVGRVRPEGRVD